MIRLKGRTALVTGASRGIGRGITRKFAASGVTRIAVGYLNNSAAAEETAIMLREAGAEVLLVRADVTKAEDVARMFAEVRSCFGTLDIFVNNAVPAVELFYEPVMQIPLKKWQMAFDSQVRALLLAAREVVAMMPDGGRIIAITYAPGGSTGSWQPYAAMGSAKAALESLCRYLSCALASRGITVNAISPGATEDSIFNTLPPAVLQSIRAWAESGWNPMRRIATPADIGNAVSLLCTEEADFITGQVLIVDGGASVMSADLPPEIQGFS